ncbi:MarR family winged helix-turn-helix transcriptional regulator [Corynebacterium aquatimens]|uniref:DNA-binding MarR family transcriptional regulator n=1 Tax=Corynebacterium aquatimens TaxID=1190508 RepID=A0A931DYH3_9CORY|nr:MarR family transcriptional regulator [Corynebacterium aquatimens]MBG6121339.1 DNA-binding MarR family transcriptional regulator [Corynebacterium aquatimens]
MATGTRWLNDEEQQLWRLMLATGRRIDRCLEDTLMHSGGLSSSEFAVLIALSEAEDHRMRMRDLCIELDWDRSRMSHQITRMDKRGLLNKHKSEEDARGVVVVLTDEGMARLEAAVPDHVEVVRRLIFDHMKKGEVAPLKRFMEGLMSASDELDVTEFSNKAG